MTQSGRIGRVNGVDLYFEVTEAVSPLLLLSGFSGTGQDWKPSLQKWSRDFHLILPGLRGHGRSGILSKPFRHDGACADLFALLDRLEVGAFKGVGIPCSQALPHSPTVTTISPSRRLIWRRFVREHS